MFEMSASFSYMTSPIQFGVYASIFYFFRQQTVECVAPNGQRIRGHFKFEANS